MAASDDLPMGEGNIPPNRLPEEVRVLRHNFRNLRTTQMAHSELVNMGITRSLSAEAKALLVEHGLDQLRIDVFGEKRFDGDIGVVGRMENTLGSVKTMQKWMLSTLVSLLIVLVGALIVFGIRGIHP